MKKHAIRVISLALALLLALPALSLAQEADDPILFTIDGTAYTKSQVDASMDSLLSNGYLDSEYDYETAIEYIINDRVIEAKIAELGLDQYTDEEKAAFTADAQEEWDELIDDYVNYYLTEDSEEARAELKQNGEALYASYGYSVGAILDNLMMQDSYERLQEYILGQQNVTVGEDEIRAIFDEYAQQDKELYEGNVYMYELYKNYGQESWYIPDGYRGILHILISVDEELLAAYQDAQNAYEESLSSEEGGDSAALLAAADAARQAVLDSEKAAIDDIYARLEKGESFESLIALYGEDDGMKDEVYLKNGYEVHRDSIMWDAAFTAGAFQEKMQKPGDVSDPVVGSFGIHILYYLRDIPGGVVELDDEIHGEIQEYLESVKQNEIFSNAVESWEAEHSIQLNTEAIEALQALAEAAEPAADDAEDVDQDDDFDEEDAADDAEDDDEDVEDLGEISWEELMSLLSEDALFEVEEDAVPEE